MEALMDRRHGSISEISVDNGRPPPHRGGQQRPGAKVLPEFPCGDGPFPDEPDGALREVDMALNTRHALITGSSRGIGRGIALKLAEGGVRVAIHYYQNEAAALDTLAEVRKRGSDGLIVQADVSQPDQITRMFSTVKEQFGTLDVFVSNARPEAPAFFSPPMEITLQQWDTAFDSQAKAFLVGAREAIPLMGTGGRIVAITYAEGSRTGGLQPWVGMGSAKAALESLVRYFAVALAKRGITVNAISPGWTEDSVLNTLPEEVQKLIRGWHTRGWTPMGRLGTPEDIGNVVALFCCEDAGWITGQVIYADGGASLMNPEIPSEIQLA
jgi:NAD(P)-dependent dehydrogenase (short-subunit alcohol dehydrogenase family)